MDKVFKEEQQKLTEIETKIDAIASRYEVKAKELQTEIADFFVSDPEDLQSKQYLMSQRASNIAYAEKFRSYQPSPYWEQVLTTLSEPKLRDYFSKFGLSYPDTSLHTSATVSLFEQGLRQIGSVIAETEKKRETAVQRLETVISEIIAIQGELNSSKAQLTNIKGQTVSRVELEIAAEEDYIHKSGERIVALKLQLRCLQKLH